MLKVIIVTLSHDSDNTIGLTLNSVLNLRGKFELHYHIHDSGSTDNTMAIVHSYKSRFGSIEAGEKKVTYTFESSANDSMYDATQKAFSKFTRMPDDTWMTCINSDSTLHENAISHLINIEEQLPEKIKWITGKTAVSNLDGVEDVLSVVLNSAVISCGLCDGKHWSYLRQEGTFFRKELWNYFNIHNNLRKFKYAGDWFFWVKLAEQYRIFQINQVMAFFNKKELMLSQSNFIQYMDETNVIISMEDRKKSLKNLLKEDTNQYTIKLIDEKYYISESTIIDHAEYKLKEMEHELNHLKFDDSVAAYDGEWQFPAITEKHAYKKILEHKFEKENNIVYIAFPWATLIDYLNCKKKSDAARLRRVLIDLRMYARKYKRAVTVCQHIHMLRYQELFDFVGVTDVFWTHAVHNQNFFPNFCNVKIHPFPLFPVQAVGIEAENYTTRDILYSFVGARANEWYLTNSRNLIIDCLDHDKRGLVIGRDNWHYHKVVYEHQINKKISDDKLIDHEASEQFKTILKKSIFSLCPSGSGPNSIRLWESIGFGSIPVILADTYLPPGDQSLWEEAAVFCDETEEAIRALPSKLEELAKDEALLDRKRHAMQKLWMLYGPDCFVHDILELFIESKTKTHPPQMDGEEIPGGKINS